MDCQYDRGMFGLVNDCWNVKLIRISYMDLIADDRLIDEEESLRGLLRQILTKWTPAYLSYGFIRRCDDSLQFLKHSKNHCIVEGIIYLSTLPL